jgi:Winged helix-turn helix
LRNHAHASLDKEAAALDQVLAKASEGGVVVIPQLRPAFEKALGKPLALSTLYRMLARHGWRKIAPDTVHPQGDPQRREDFKKNSTPSWRKR